MVKKCSFTYFIGYVSETNFFSVPLCIKLSQINKYVKYFDNNNKYINLLVHNNELFKNTMQYGMKLVIYQKRNLIACQCIVINILKLR